MIPAVALLSILALVAMVGIALSLRSLVMDERRTESQVQDPHTPTVTYAIPVGIDPVVFAVAVKHAGFLSVVTDVGASQGLRVQCDAGDRERLRRVLEGVVVNGYDGTAVKVDHVVFEDER
jgi:hypothetical protein